MVALGGVADLWTSSCGVDPDRLSESLSEFVCSFSYTIFKLAN